MKRIPIIMSLVAAELFLAAGPARAIPAFARKHGFNCNMCHTAFPELNDFGQRVRDDGYQIPGQEGREAGVIATPPPIAFRASTGLALAGSDAGSTAGFGLFGFDLLASGVLHKNVSFLIIYTPRLDEPAAAFSGGEPGQTGALESANLVFSNLIPGALNLRIGRFEPAVHAFSSKRSFYLFSPYEAFEFTTPNNTHSFADNQVGVEASGHFRNGFKYGCGIVNGTGANPDNNRNKDVYLNLFQTFGRGDGQTAGQRIGVFGYYGWQPTRVDSAFMSPTGETDGSGNKAFYRIGLDGSFNWKTLNVECLWMKGADDKAFNTIEPNENYAYTGWLAKIDYAALINNRLMASVLFNRVSPPDADEERRVDTMAGLVRYYLGDWSAVNIAVHGEVARRTTGDADKTADTIYSLLLDFSF
jgi:hypothetical protein